MILPMFYGTFQYLCSDSIAIKYLDILLLLIIFKSYESFCWAIKSIFLTEM